MEEARPIERFDLAVVGGGPAGTSAAITAARAGHSVVLLERGKFPRQKVCGEFISSEAVGLVKELGGDSARLMQQPLRIKHARIFIDCKVVETAVDPPASSIARFVMDAALWQAAKEAGVTALEASAVEEISGDGPFRIVTRDSSYIARSVINASGRWSNVSSDGGTQLSRPKLEASVGLKQHFWEVDPAQSVNLYFFPGGYCGVQPIGENEINASAMVLPDRAKSLKAVFELEPNLRARTQSWQPTTDLVTTFPLIFKDPRPVQGKRNILNVGDAAAFIDPFVGDGISMALHGGRIAADCLGGFLSDERTLDEAVAQYRSVYEERLRPAFRNAARLRKLIASPSLRGLAMELFRVPAISRLALRSTRARTA